jgi:hypothetical protein
VLTPDKLRLALERSSDRMLDHIPLHEVLAVSIGPPEKETHNAAVLSRTRSMVEREPDNGALTSPKSKPEKVCVCVYVYLYNVLRIANVLLTCC